MRGIALRVSSNTDGSWRSENLRNFSTFIFSLSNVCLRSFSTLSTSLGDFVSTLFMTTKSGFSSFSLIILSDERFTVPAFTSNTQKRASHSLITSAVLSASSLSLDEKPGVSRMLMLCKFGLLQDIMKYLIRFDIPSISPRTLMSILLNVFSLIVFSSLSGVKKL